MAGRLQFSANSTPRRELAAAQAQAFGCTADVDWREEEQPYYPPTVNDAGAYAFAADVYKRRVPANLVAVTTATQSVVHLLDFCLPFTTSSDLKYRLLYCAIRCGRQS